MIQPGTFSEHTEKKAWHRSSLTQLDSFLLMVSLTESRPYHIWGFMAPSVTSAQKKTEEAPVTLSYLLPWATGQKVLLLD